MDAKKTMLNVLQSNYDGKILLHSSDVSELLGVSQGTVTNMVKGNRIPYLKFGDAKTSTIRFDIVALAHWLESKNSFTKGVQNES